MWKEWKWNGRIRGDIRVVGCNGLGIDRFCGKGERVSIKPNVSGNINAFHFWIETPVPMMFWCYSQQKYKK